MAATAEVDVASEIPHASKHDKRHIHKDTYRMRKTLFCCVALGTLSAVLAGMSGCATGVSKTPPPTITLSVNPASINPGQSVTVSWQSTNATSVSITATAGSSTKTLTTSPQASGSVTDTPTQNTTYSGVATGPSGTSSTETAKVLVGSGPSPAPVITQFTATPATVGGGQTTTLTWATTNATAVTITPAVPIPEDSNGLPTSGSSVAPLTSTTTFSLTATGPGGTAGPQTVTVTVPFTLTLTASASTITSGETVTLAWQASGGTPTSLSLADGAGNMICNPCALPQGTASVSPSATTTYTATAAVNANTSITESATVTVSQPTAGAIKHIFFMLQENRAFDNYFGQLGPYRTSRLAQVGITDSQTVDGTPTPLPVLTQHNTTPQVKASPFHEPTVCTENLTPSWDESHHDVNLAGGDSTWATTTTFTNSSFSMDNFMDTALETNKYDPDGTRTLGYYDQTDLPYYYDLATFFATSDAWHSPILANTVPNRMYLMAGTSFGHEYPDNGGHPAYAAPTIFRAMNTANVSWNYYYKDGVFLANFADYSDPTIQSKILPETDLMKLLAGTCSGGTCDPDQALPQVIFIDSASGSSALDEHPDNNMQSGAAYVAGSTNSVDFP